MSDSYRDLHGDAYKEWRDERADKFVQLQRRAFLAGFEAAADESREFRHLRTWVEEQRDEAARKEQEREDGHMMTARRMAFSELLVKLHEMGNPPEEDADE